MDFCLDGDWEQDEYNRAGRICGRCFAWFCFSFHSTIDNDICAKVKCQEIQLWTSQRVSCWKWHQRFGWSEERWHEYLCLSEKCTHMHTYVMCVCVSSWHQSCMISLGWVFPWGVLLLYILADVGELISDVILKRAFNAKEFNKDNLFSRNTVKTQLLLTHSRNQTFM